MEVKKKNVFTTAATRIPIKILDMVIIIGIVAMAALIPILSMKGGFTVSFDSVGGSTVESQRLRYGDQIAEPETPTRENYVFDGWYYDAEGKREFDFETSCAQSSMTLFAVWLPVEE